jgi:TM2 domain-containing membrane protein YozV
MPFCETCGVEGGGDYCPACGEVRSFAAKAVAAGEVAKRPGALTGPVQPAQAMQVVVAEANHGVPALLSFFMPGLGQLVKGPVGKGLGTWAAMACAGVAGFFVGYTFLALPAIWIWGIYDAYKSNTPKLGV